MAMNTTLARKKLAALLDGEEMVTAYIRKFGTEINHKFIEEIRKTVKIVEAKELSEDTKGFYSIKVRCPVCKEPDIPCYELKGKSQLIKLDLFLNPIYQGLPGNDTVNYTKMAVSVCMNCYFASPDKRDFITYSMITKSEKDSIIPSMVLHELTETTAMRQKMVSNIKDSIDFFSVPRIMAAVIMTYKLAMHRALVESKYEIPYSLFKAGSYALRIAHLQKDTGSDPTKAYQEAYKLLKKCFADSNTPDPDVEYKSLYLIITLALRLKMEKEASDYVSSFEKISHKIKADERAGKKVDKIPFDKWQRKTKELWENRNEPDLWDRAPA